MLNFDPSGSRIIDSTYFSNNVDNKYDTLEREITLTTGVENANPLLTKRDVILLTAQIISSSGPEEISASFIFADFS